MGLKEEINIGDYVMYKEGRNIVVDFDTKCPLKVIDIKFYNEVVCIFYENGEFDHYDSVIKCPSLILELI